jgi:hypothetical protein
MPHSSNTVHQSQDTPHVLCIFKDSVATQQISAIPTRCTNKQVIHKFDYLILWLCFARKRLTLFIIYLTGFLKIIIRLAALSRKNKGKKRAVK